MQIVYGANGQYIDVTGIAVLKFSYNGSIVIPAGDHARADCFGDPLYLNVKEIKCIADDGITTSFSADQEAVISMPNLREVYKQVAVIATPEELLAFLQRNLVLVHGSFQEEYPEQLMVAKFLRPSATVLELGANVGRNTLIIASILDNDRRLVTLECDPATAVQLDSNRLANRLNFQIEPSALSRQPLCQRGWDTIVYDGVNLPAEFSKVQTITWDAIQAKYNLRFDTIVADCEGALCQILRDEPTLLANIHTLILENDFHSLEEKHAVDQAINNAGLRLVYTEGLGTTWPTCPAMTPFFFQVFRR